VAKIIPQVEHIIVVMLENRSFDNMLGWLYATGPGPAVFLPQDSSPRFDGLRPDLWNPSNSDYFMGQQPQKVMAAGAVTGNTVPDPDPEETFANVIYQLYGPEGVAANPSWPMQGFVQNYAATGALDATQVMQGHSIAQLPILSALARNYAVSDAWFASVPSQTWPNRAFAHAGTSNGHVDNGQPADPLDWDVPTIFNVLKSIGVSWGVYSDAVVAPSLTRTMFPKLWDPWLDGHFQRFQAFIDDCASNTLPSYSFIEPSFLLNPNDQHPPHDVSAGEAFLFAIWTAVSTSPGWEQTLLVITYDEHGGCYDHVLPPIGAIAPDQASAPGDAAFLFDRFGVRVPTVVVSPYIAAGTVFRSDKKTPYDHASILATLRDWVGIDPGAMLSSARVAAAPNLAQVLTLAQPRSDVPTLIAPAAPQTLVSLAAAPNNLQESLVSGAARRFGMDPAAVAAQTHTRQLAVDFFKRRPSKAGV
jgi:phospholipase C